ncbi:EAL domain-containing protein [Leclercia adecarboxylata]|uniref:EAL domain-containing protein n=1 Tax=Leclercia adecarboxylata TaxID=83655 RepID=UPI00057B5C2A|nr:EAL domain-containing protein [Leclercia adecarboxylata]
MYRLPFENAVRGIRFQPIYSVAEKMIKAWEVLSLLQPDMDPERYFSAQPDSASLKVLCWQLQIIYKMKNRKRYYLNVPARLLCSSQAIEQLLPWLREGIVLEVQDPHGFISLSYPERQAFYAYARMIKSMGAEIWLDDILPAQATCLGAELARFDGVKIDRSVLQDPSALIPLINRCARYVNAVLVEGVENSQHFQIAKGGGSHFLQGFMWPEEQFYISYTPG